MLIAATKPDTSTTPRADTQQRVQNLPPYRVLLHNDDENSFDHVIRTIVRLTPLDEQQAVQCACEADTTGVSLLLVTHRERAELYVEQFATFNLTVTCEPEA